MISEDRIKKMIRLSDYESGIGDRDLRITRYKKKDYVRLGSLRTVAGIMAATVLVLVFCAFYFADMIPWSEYVSEGLFTFNNLLWFAGGVAVWLILLAIAVSYSRKKNKQEYMESSARVAEYEQTVLELINLYEKEKEKEESV